VLELAVAFRKDSTSICSETGEEKLVCQAHINNADEEEHHGDMRDPVTSQTEASFQARIKKLEDENRALVVSKSVIKASKQPDQTEIRRLQRKINFHEELHTTNSQHYDAEIKRLEEKNETLAKVKDDEISVLRKEYGDLSGTHDALLKRATTEWDSQAACISELQQEKSTLSKKISELTTNAELHDVNISWLENDMKKEKDELKEQVRDLQEELKKAKETIAASKASPSTAPLPTPASTAQTGRSPSPLFQSAGQKWVGGYPSPSMSSSQGSSMSGGASSHMPDSEVTPPPAPAQSSSLKMGRYDVVHAHVEKQRDVAPEVNSDASQAITMSYTLGGHAATKEVSDNKASEQTHASMSAESRVSSSGRATPMSSFDPSEYGIRNDSLIIEDSGEEESNDPARTSIPVPCQWDTEDPLYIEMQRINTQKIQITNLQIHLTQDIEESKRKIRKMEEASGQAAERSSGRAGANGAVDTPVYSNATAPAEHIGQPRAVSNEVLAVSPAPASTPEQASADTSTGLAINTPAVPSRAVSNEVPATSHAFAPAPGQTSANTSTSRAINTPAVRSRDAPSGVPTIPAHGATGPGGESSHQRLAREQRAVWDRKSEQRKQMYGDDYDDDDVPDQSSVNQSASRATNTPAGRSRSAASEGPAYPAYGREDASEGNSMEDVEDTGDGGANSQGFEGFDEEDSEGEGQSDPMDEDDEDDYMSDGEPATTTPARFIPNIGKEFDTINDSAVPTGPKKNRQAGGGSNKRTGTRGAIQKGAGSNAATSRHSVRGRPSQNPRQQSEGTGFHGAHQRQQQASADRSAYTGKTSSRGTNQARRGGRGRSQATRGGVRLSTGNFYTNDRAQADQKRLGKAKRNPRGGR
jgi:hypothetical protein